MIPKVISKTQGSEEYTTYTYNANNQLTREDEIEGTELEERTDYEYNASGQLVKKTYYYTLSDGTVKTDSYYTYEYSSTTSKNPTKQTSYGSNGDLFGTEEYQYDDNKTFFSAIAQGALFAEVAAEENNVTKIIKKNTDGEVESTTTIVYVYNDKGYPTKTTRTQVYTGGDTYSDIAEYTYNCK